MGSQRLRDRVAVLTGGTRGLGLAMARAFAAEGAAVVVGSRSAVSVEEAVARIRAEGGRASGLPCRVDDLGQVRALAGHALEVFGRLDIWVNNAGLSCPTGPTAHIPSDMVEALIRTNILGVYNGSVVALRHFAAQGSGKLINISGKGERKPFALHNPYASSKAWEHNFTMALAKEYKGAGVGVYLFNPGVVDSDMFRHLSFVKGYEQNLRTFKVVMGMLANPPEVAAEKAVRLASEETDGRTGLKVSLVGPGAMMKAMGREIGRRLVGRKPKPLDVRVSLVEPEIRTPPLARRVVRRGRGAYVVDLRARRLPPTIGAKARGLRFLMDRKFLVPETWVCTWEAYEDHASGKDGVLEALRLELESALEPGGAYAVRSSSNMEDGPEHSFAGQFESVLGLRGVEDIVRAIERVWAAAGSDTARSYLARTGMDPSSLRMAAIVQRMVEPVLSGVAFSKNPLNGLDEVLVEAVRGSGTALVQGGATPLRWIDKWGGWIEKPDKDDVSEELVQRIVAGVRAVKRSAGKDVDLEWVFDGRELHWLQFRDITALGGTSVYSSRMAREMTPGMIHPLVWSVVVPIPSRVWAGMIREAFGRVDIDPGRMAKAFHYRAYHNLSEFGRVFSKLGMPAESLEMMMGVTPPGAGKPGFRPGPRALLLIPRILRFLGRRWTFARRLERDYPRLRATAAEFPLEPSETLDEPRLLEAIDRIGELNTEMTFDTINAVMLLQVHAALLRSRLKKAGVDYESVDLTAGMDELKHYDPGTGLENLNRTFRGLPDGARAVVEGGDFGTFRELDGIEEFRRGVLEFLDRFGHMSDTTGHFGSAPWRETPGVVLRLIAGLKAPEGRAEGKTPLEDLVRTRRLGRSTRRLVRRYRRFRLFREKYSSLYSYSLMLFRAYYLTVGKRFARRGIIVAPEDILFLFDGEVRGLASGALDRAGFRDLVAARKADMERSRDAVLPDIIFGETAPPVVLQLRERLKGTPTSKGCYTGPARVVRGVGEFHRLRDGDVLVIPHSDVSWTPLFAKAGAVVAESGGILSHSSIIAREYGIPAVVSARGALGLPDGATVTVDGASGEILVHQNPTSSPSLKDIGGRNRDGSP